MKYLWISLLLLAGCHGGADHHEEEVRKEVITEIGEDIRVPQSMWQALAGKKEAEGGGGHGKKQEEHGKKEEGHGEGGDDVYIFSDVTVVLKEKNPGIVKEKEVHISFPRGGGEIDLSKYIQNKQGSFFVNFEVPEFEDATGKKVIFISNSRKRKIDEKVFGSGCHEYFDITDRFFKESKNGGIKVNTTRNRHVSVLGGTFILVAKKNKQNFFTQVTFTDRSHTNLLCQENP